MYESTEAVTLVANQLSYSTSDESWLSEVLELYSVIYDDASNVYKGLIKIHPRQIGNVATATAGPPKYYCLHDRLLYIFPLTSAAIVTAVGVLSCLVSLETDDITDLTDEYQHLPIIYALGKANQRDQKQANAKAYFDQFYQEVNFERQDKHAREVDSIDKFRIPLKGAGPESTRG